MGCSFIVFDLYYIKGCMDKALTGRPVLPPNNIKCYLTQSCQQYFRTSGSYSKALNFPSPANTNIVHLTSQMLY